MSRTWSELGVPRVGPGMRNFKETPQEELEWEVVKAELALEHRRKLLANGYSPPVDVSTWWAERMVEQQRKAKTG